MIERAIFILFLSNLSKKGNVGAKILLDHVKFLLDIFHVMKHKSSAVCLQTIQSAAIILIWKHSKKSAEQTRNPQNKAIAFLTDLNTFANEWLN